MNQEGGDRYILFQTGGATFGTPLLSIREIVDPLPFRPVPSPFEYFLGISNLRGQVIGVLDLELRLGMKAASLAPHPSLVIFEVEGLSYGVYVEKMESAVTLEDSAIIKDSLIDFSLPAETLLGVAEIGQKFVPLVSFMHLGGESTLAQVI